MEDKSISINIWDDFFDDGFVPEGEIQETYAYLESTLNDEDCKNVLELLKEKIAVLLPLVQLSLEYYDSAKVYPNLVGTEHEYCLYKRWQLHMKHISHENIDFLVTEIKGQDLSYINLPIVVYSES